MFVVVLVAQIVAFGVQPIVPLYVRAMAGDVPWLPIAAGAAFAVMGVADLLASPFLGKRSDKIGYRRVLLISLAGVAAFTVPQAFAWSVGAFLAMRFGVGTVLGRRAADRKRVDRAALPRRTARPGLRDHVERDVPGDVVRAADRRLSGGAVRFSGRLLDDRRADARESCVGGVQRAASAAGNGTNSLNARTSARDTGAIASVKRAIAGLSISKTPATSSPANSGTTISEREAAVADDVIVEGVDVVDDDRLAARHGGAAYASPAGSRVQAGVPLNGPSTSSPLPAFTK